MKLNRKTSIVSLFLAGVLLSSAVAAADIIIGDGYSGVKKALKHTTKTLAHNTDSFSLSSDYELKFDGEVRSCASETLKYDFKNQRREETIRNFEFNREEYTSYYYTDSEKNISKYSNDDVYYQVNHTEPAGITMDDPFEEDFAADFEKVADAFVSNMKDFVQVNESDDGSKLYYGSLESAQMPAFLNALSTVFLKYAFLEEYNRDRLGIPELTDNLYCSEITGKVSQNSDALIDSMVGTAVMIGTDKSGESHTIEFTIAAKIWDINATTVSEPQIGENVIVSDENSDSSSLSLKNIGVYKSNIISSDNDACQKIGERILTFTDINDDSIQAHLTVTDSENEIDCDITAEKFSDEYETYSYYFFEYTDFDGEQRYGLLFKDNYISQYDDNIMVNLNVTDFSTDPMRWSRSDSSKDNFLVTRYFE